MAPYTVNLYLVVPWFTLITLMTPDPDFARPLPFL